MRALCYFTVQSSMTLTTQPHDFQRFRVVGVVHFGKKKRADGARLWFKTAAANSDASMGSCGISVLFIG
jgi:hypothetical protein